MNTYEILQIAAELAGMEEIPADSAVHVPGENLSRVLVGIDVDAAEILLARELKVDGVISHHPGGSALVNMYKVMERQIDRMVEAGVPINKAQKALRERMEEVDRHLHVTNYDRGVSAARLLNMPFVGIHSPADVLAERRVQEHLDKELNLKPKATLKDVLEVLNEIPEYRLSAAKPVIRVGGEKDFAGRILVTMAGGTSGGPEVAKAYFEAGVGTLVMMHVPDDTVKAVREQKIGNIIVAGHMASDSIGLNILIQALEKKGLTVVRASGVIEI